MGQPSSSGVAEQSGLFDYGIHNEQSDIRCHVAPLTRLIFVFKTAAALSLDLTKYECVSGFQPGVAYATSRGYRVPPEDIPDLRVIKWYSEPWWDKFRRDASTSEKGALAVDCATRLMRAGRFPLWLADAQDSSRVEVQRSGTDILLWGKWRIQVKCDYIAGRGDNGLGSGHLFLQVAERNPLRKI